MIAITVATTGDTLTVAMRWSSGERFTGKPFMINDAAVIRDLPPRRSSLGGCLVDHCCRLAIRRLPVTRCRRIANRGEPAGV